MAAYIACRRLAVHGQAPAGGRIMTAPAAILLAKIIVPETGSPVTQAP